MEHADLCLDRLVALASRTVAQAGNGGALTVEPMPGLVLLRQVAPSPFEATLYEPVLCLILQGRKEVSSGQRTYAFGAGDCLLVSHVLPVAARIAQAPYLALVLKVDVGTIRKLDSEMAGAEPDDDGADAARMHPADAALLDACGRYLALSGSSADARILGPLIQKELHYRLLTAPFGGMLRRLLIHHSTASAVARAIERIRRDLCAPVFVPDLARHVGMSASSFHKHFKTITATTPLQFQKELRLLEARRLLRTGSASVTTAAIDVGYESPSQFSREYSRKFGVPPRQHLVRRTA